MVWVVLVEKVDPARSIAGFAPEVAVEISVPIVVAGIRMEAIEGVSLRVGADQRVVGDDGRGPHVGVVGAPTRWIAVARTPPPRIAHCRRWGQPEDDSNRQQDGAPHEDKVGRLLPYANLACQEMTLDETGRLV